MKITPLDIQQQQFKGKFLGGLDPEDVDTFLQLLAQEMENLIRENSEQKEQLRRCATDLDRLSQQERTMREALISAQKVTEEMKSLAQKEAGLIVSDAEIKAEKILRDGELRLAQLKNDIQEMRRQKLQFEHGLRALLDKHLKMLAAGDE
ncbi:MAG TPA: DivIVA domain-containing protein [Geobacterales bacterium]|nr:DivIVA domain-containing protein [Geobacterales bacterium]